LRRNDSLRIYKKESTVSGAVCETILPAHRFGGCAGFFFTEIAVLKFAAGKFVGRGTVYSFLVF
jgi:hypothetical protein